MLITSEVIMFMCLHKDSYGVKELEECLSLSEFVILHVFLGSRMDGTVLEKV
jgi:hypothetical protein